MSVARPVIFAGENPLLMLYRPGTETLVAVASLWCGVCSEAGAGYALVIWTDPEESELGEHAPTGIWTDNADLARLVWSNFSQHFYPFQERGIAPEAARPARFVQDAGGRRYHRITCAAGPTTIELRWEEVLDVVQNRETSSFGGATWEISNVVCPCARGAILIDGLQVPGEARPTGGTYQTSAFLAFCESWVRLA